MSSATLRVMLTSSIPRCLAVPFFAAIATLAACGGSDAARNPAPPPGSCPASPTAATGSSSASCTECGKAKCNTELSQSSGSGWASQYIGGDGSCVDYDACACACYGSSGTSDALLTCVTNCTPQLDATCQAALTATYRCIDQQCSAECR